MTRRPHDSFPPLLVAAVIAIAALVMIAARISWAGGEMPEQTTATYGGAADGAPWYITLLIVCGPGIGAVLLTIATVTMIRRINRADGRPPLKVLASVLWTLACGAAWGPAIQWSMQELVASLTGIAPNFKLIVIAPFITGIASLVAYDLLRWYTKTRHPGLYALISVKHRKDAGHEGGNGEDGDLTYYMAQGEDDTIPRD